MNTDDQKNFGGVYVHDAKIGTNAPTRQLLGETPYRYELVHLAPNEKFQIDATARYCVYVLTADVPVIVNEFTLDEDDFALGNANTLAIFCSGAFCRILLVSQQSTACGDPLKQFKCSEAKKVEKPWGHEIWLTGDPSPVFAFKRILLKAGNRTSLQYHRYKRETNFIVAGSAILHFNPRQDVPAPSVTPDMIAQAPLTGPVVADVFPERVHRLEALTDLLLLEVSTPELDDVIRIHDETGRSHGRISNEHSRR